MEENICSHCTEKLKSDNGIKCTGPCGGVFHLKCVSLSSKDYNVAKNVGGFKWFCGTCLPFVEFIKNMHGEFNNFKSAVMTELNVIRNKIEKITPVEDKKSEKSYARVVTGEAVVIKPRSNQDCTRTREAVVKKLKPSKMEVSITQVRNIKDGGILIKCKSKEEIERLKKEAEMSLGRNYQVRIPEQKNPCIKICGFEEEMDPDELMECIRSQNSFLREGNIAMKVIVLKKMKTRYMAIIQCDPSTHARILEEGSLSIGWTPLCRVFDYVRMFRCFQCGGFNHKSTDCKLSEVCLKCGEMDHLKQDCTQTHFKCLNCMEANRTLNCNFDVNHSIFDNSECSVYLKKVAIEKQKIRLDLS